MRTESTGMADQTHVLFVEDDDVIREATQLTLERDGFAVTAMPDGLSGLDRTTMRTNSMKPATRFRSTFNTILIVSLLLGTLTVTAWITPSKAVSAGLAPVCRSADAFSADQIIALGRIVSWTDSTSVRVRTALQLPQLSASAVTLVTQAQTCSKAAQALADKTPGLVVQLINSSPADTRETIAPAMGQMPVNRFISDVETAAG